MRALVINIKENLYVEAGRAIGCSTTRLLMRHIVPNILPAIVAVFSIRLPGVILAEAGLSFLGLGVPPPAATWGGMLSSEGRRFMMQSPGLAFWPGLALAIVVYGVNMFGDALRDLLDPRLKGGVGRYTMPVRKVKKAEREGEKKQKSQS